jgi:hypothetical protein
MDPKNTAEPQFSNRQIYVGFGTVLIFELPCERKTGPAEPDTKAHHRTS